MRVGLWSAGGRTDGFTRPSAFQDGGLWPTSYGPLCRTQNLAPTVVPTLSRHTLRTKLSLPASTSITQNSLHVSATNNSSSESLSPDEEAAYQEFLQKRAAERKAWKQEMRRRAKFDPMASPPSQTATSSPSPPSAAPLAPSAVSPPAPLPALTRPKPPLSPRQATNPTTPASTASLKQTTNPVRNAPNAGTTQLRPPSRPLNIEAPNTRSISNCKDTPKAIEVQDDEEEDEDELDLDAMVAMARRIMQEPDNDDEEVAIEEEEDGEEDMDRTARGLPAALQRPVRQAVRSAGSTSSSGTSSGRGDVSAGTGAGGVAPSSQSLPPSRGPPGAPAPKRRLMPIAQRQRAAAAAAAAEAAAVEAARVPSTSGRQGSAGVAAAGGGTRRLRAATGSSRREPQQRRQEEVEEEEEENEVADDLDWEALQAYEKYEQYLNEVAEEAPKRSPTAAASKRPQPLPRPAPGRVSYVGNSPNSAPTSTSATGAAAAAAKKTEGAPKAKPASAAAGVGASSSSSSGNKSSLARVDGSGRSKASLLEGDDEDEDDNGNDPASRLDAQLDQWEQLIRLFEMAEKESKREEAKQQKSKAAAASEVVDEKEEEAEEANVDWQALEKLFLGDKWETELDDLQTRVATGVAEAEAAMQSSEAGEGGEGADVEPWKDELSTLLVGLVDISARRYLGRNLLPPPTSSTSTGAPLPPGVGVAGAAAADGNTTSSGSSQGASAGVAAAPQQQAAQQLGEEERAEAYWQAPFLFLVQDDSPDPVLEYVNAAALDALRLGSFQDATAGIPAATLVDERHAPSQSEWIWAVSEATERPEGYAIIPSLRLRGPGPDAPTILATDVAVFQVDSLQGEPIGQAVVAANWRVLAAGE